MNYVSFCSGQYGSMSVCSWRRVYMLALLQWSSERERMWHDRRVSRRAGRQASPAPLPSLPANKLPFPFFTAAVKHDGKRSEFGSKLLSKDKSLPTSFVPPAVLTHLSHHDQQAAAIAELSPEAGTWRIACYLLRVQLRESQPVCPSFTRYRNSPQSVTLRETNGWVMTQGTNE